MKVGGGLFNQNPTTLFAGQKPLSGFGSFGGGTSLFGGQSLFTRPTSSLFQGVDNLANTFVTAGGNKEGADEEEGDENTG